MDIVTDNTKNSNTDGPLVSIVTPVFNGQRHLRECIESVLSQTWTNWQYVIVDNCSTDATRRIALDYAARDSRIRVIRNDEFVGVIANHNIALGHVPLQSRYVKFVHADDWLYPECIASMVAVAEANPTVGLVGAYRLKEDRVELTGLEYPSSRVPGRWLARQSLLGALWVFGSPTSTMLRMAAIRPLFPFYNEDNLHADTEACYRVLEHWDFGFVHQVLTYTRSHQGSVTSAVAPLNTHIVGNLAILLKYGPEFLTPQEMKTRSNEVIHDYYAFLGQRAPAMPGPEFWQYHRKAAARLGIPLGYHHLLPYVLSECWRLMWRPLGTVRALKRRCQEPRAHSAARSQVHSA